MRDPRYPVGLLTPELQDSPLLDKIQIDQMAFCSRSEADTAMLKKLFRLDRAKWLVDEVEAEGYVRGHGFATRNRARLEFNYDLGIELEILRYLDGANYLDETKVPSCHMCHVGAHVLSSEGLRADLGDYAFVVPMIQQVRTVSHTNPFLIEIGRRYKYTIYDTRNILGTHLKLIERMETNGDR